MTGGKHVEALAESDLMEDYYSNLHIAYNNMRDAFEKRALTGFTQDHLAHLLDVDKALISRRLNGRENLTLKTLSYMASAMQCRLMIAFQPYEEIMVSNYYGMADIVELTAKKPGPGAGNAAQLTV